MDTILPGTQDPISDPAPQADIKEELEAEPAEWASMTKAQKKKAKKAKRTSAVETAPSEPATPTVEEPKELALDDPSTGPIEEAPVIPDKPIKENPPLTIATEDTVSDVKPTENMEESTPTTSKKDKKKAKKQSKKTATEPFLAFETPEEAKVSDTQPSPSPSTLSETPIPFSGIPTSYPLPVIASEFVDLASASAKVQPESKDEELAGAGEEKVDVEQLAVEGQLRGVGVEDKVVEFTKEEEKSEEKKEEKIATEMVEETSIAVQPTTEAADSIAEVPDVPAVVVPQQAMGTHNTKKIAKAQDVAQLESIVPEETTLSEVAKLPEKHQTTAIEPTADIVEPEVFPTESAPTNVEHPKEATEDSWDATSDPSKKKKSKKGKRASVASDIVPQESTLQSLRDVTEEISQVTDDTVIRTIEEASSTPVTTNERIDDASKLLETKYAEVAKVSSAIDKPRDMPVQEVARSNEIVEGAAAVVESEQPVEGPAEDTSTSNLKRDKKKDKKKKKQSGVSTPLEAAEEPQPVLSEETVSKTTLEMPTVDIPVVEPEAVTEVSELLSEQPTVPLELASEVQRERSQVSLPEQLQTNEVTSELPSELQHQEPTEVLEPLLSKKEKKKKGKKAKSQSDVATPVEETVSETVVEKAKDEHVQVELVPETAVNEPESFEQSTIALPIVEPPLATSEEVAEVSKVEAVNTETLRDVDMKSTEDVTNSAPNTIEQDDKKGRGLETATSAVDSMTDLRPAVETVPVIPDSPLPVNVVDTATVAEPAVEAEDVPLSKKEKKKGKKSKAKSSGTATPIVEYAPTELVDAMPAAAIAQQNHQPAVADTVSASPSQEEVASSGVPEKLTAPTVQEEDLISTREDLPEAIIQGQGPTSVVQAVVETPVPKDVSETTPAPADVQKTVPVDSEPSVETSQKSKKKKRESKSSTTTPLAEEIEALPSTTAQVLVEEQRPSIDEPTPVVTTEDPPTNQEPAVQPTDTLVAPVQEPEQAIEESVSTAASKKKKGKKGKKSGTATPAQEDVPPVEPVPATTPVEDVPPFPATEPTQVEPVSDQRPEVEEVSIARELPKALKHVADETALPMLADDSTSESQTARAEDDNIKPISSGAIDETLFEPATEPTPLPITEPMENVNVEDLGSNATTEAVDSERPVLSRKLSKKEKKALKNADTFTPVNEPISEVDIQLEPEVEESAPTPTVADPVATDTDQNASPGAEVSTQVPSAQVEIVAEMPEPTAIIPEVVTADLVDQQVAETIAKGDEPVSTSSKSKKKKKDKKSKKMAAEDPQTEAVVPDMVVPEPAHDEDNAQAESSAAIPLPQVSPEAGSGLDQSLVQPTLDLSESVETTTVEAARQDLENPSMSDRSQNVADERNEDIATEQPTRAVLTEIPPIADPVDTVVPQENVEDAPLNRKASEKSRKGEKASLTTDESATLTEETIAPATFSTVEQGPRSEKVAMITPAEASSAAEVEQSSKIEQAQALESSIAAPALEATTRSSETNTESSSHADVANAETEADWGFTPPKKTKKDKKKVRKSALISEDLTSMEPLDERLVAAEQGATVHGPPESQETLPSFEEPTSLQERADPVSHVEEASVLGFETQNTDVTQQGGVKTPEISLEVEQKSMVVEEPDATPSRSMSKKKNKKGKKNQDDVDDPRIEESVPTVLTKETSHAPLPDVQYAQSEVVPVLPEPAVDSSGSAPSTLEVHPEDGKLVGAGGSEQIHAPLQEGSRDIVMSTVEPTDEVQEVKEAVDRPLLELSPSLKAIQDEAADLRLRSEVLDDALAKEASLETTSSASKPTSVFDIVNKLSKKDKKKAKKAKDSSLDLTSTTPVADPSVTVETKETVETSVTDQDISMPGTAVRKPTKEDEQKLEPEAFKSGVTSEPLLTSELVVELESRSSDNVIKGAAPAAMEATAMDSENFIIEHTPFLDSADPLKQVNEEVAASAKTSSQTNIGMMPKPTLEADVAVPDSEKVQPTVEQIVEPTIEVAPSSGTTEVAELTERDIPAMSPKLSKKDKKKQAKASTIAKDEPIFDVAETVPTTISETEPELEATSSMIIDQATPLDVSPTTSPKLSKKNKKKKAKDVMVPEGPVVEMVDESAIVPNEPATIMEEAATSRATSSQRNDVSMEDAPSSFPSPDAVVPDTETTVTPALMREQSKKDKKNYKKKDVVTDVAEPETSDYVEMLPHQSAIVSVPEPQDIAEETLPIKPDVQLVPTINTAPSVDARSVQSSQSIERTPFEASSTKPTLAEDFTTPGSVSASIKSKKPKRKSDVVIPSETTVGRAPASLQTDLESEPKPKSTSDALAIENPEGEVDHAINIAPVKIVEEIPEATPAPTTHDFERAVEVSEGVEPESQTKITSKKSKKEKRKAQKDADITEVPLIAPVEVITKAAAAESITNSRDISNPQGVLPTIPRSVQDLPSTPSLPAPSLEEQQVPTLNKKPSKTHKLAALFERGTPAEELTSARGLRKDGVGSVKNLAERYESQSRSVTPVLQAPPDHRSASRVASHDKLRTSSPAHDVDFAATVAASLTESGFDPGYVINDSTFHRSASAQSVRDIGHDDEVAAAKERATTSRLGSLSRSSSFSGSPRMRPVKDIGPDVLPPIEVAVASTDAVSFDPLDVLNDPTFSRRKTPPGVLEEADPEELYVSSKVNTKARGKKNRAPHAETPAEASITATASKVIERKLDNKPGREQAPAPSGEAADTLAITSSKKEKNTKKDKKRTSLTQDRVEYAATETPAIETPTLETLAVETQADSTVREVELEKSVPLASLQKNAPVQLEDTAQSEINSEIILDVGSEPTKRKSKKSKKDKAITEQAGHESFRTEETPSVATEAMQHSRSLRTSEPSEYPFPEVVTPVDNTERPLTGTTKEELEKERDMATWAPTISKKDKKSRKGKEKEDGDSQRQERQQEETGDHVQSGRKEKDPDRGLSEQAVEIQQRSPDHKRRTHPVASDEDEPEGKRLHTLDPPPTEVQSTTHSLTTTIEPAWSFSGVRDSAVDVVDSPVQTVTPHLHESTRDSGYQDTSDSPIIQEQHVEPMQVSNSEKKRRSKEPKTPIYHASRHIEQDQQAEKSSYLPDQSTYTVASTPSGTDRATKERTSYLFDSSPSTRGFETPAATAPETPVVIDTPSKDSRTSSRSVEKTSRSHSDETSPSKEVKQTEPYKSIFGDPSEKASVKSSTLSTPNPKHMRTPSNQQLDTIKEASPDDSPLHKKVRAITDVGAPERGVKSARHAESSKPSIDRLKSPPPVTPTPSSRKSVPALDNSGRRTPSGSRDTPWHQVNESVDRTMTLSPARRMPRSSPSLDPIKQHMAEQRSPSVRSERSMSNIAKLRSPDQDRPLSSMSTRSSQSLRRIDRSASGDLRNAARLGEVHAPDARSATPNLPGLALAAGATAAIAAASKYDPVRGEGKGRRASMAAETFEAWGEAQGSPMSPTRPPSVRKRQSMQIMDLQSQLDQLAAQNHSLEEATRRAEETLQATQHQRQVDEQLVAEEVEARDREIHKRDIDIAQLKDTIQRLHEEIRRLTELNNTLTEANRNLTNDTNERYAQLQSEGQLIHQQWQASQRELEALRAQQESMTRGMADAVRDEVGIALDERNAEIDRLTAELTSAKEQVKALQKQILATKKPGESFLTIRDEDYFDSACQQLCQHVQQWVLRFSKFSDTRPCRLSSEISADTRLDASTRQKIDTRLDNAVLDGSDVDALLADRVRRRDVFMSVVMTMIWEYVFTRYLFGMDREQRQKLKSLEKTLSEVGPPRAVAQWRAITLTLLSKREPFMQQRAQDTEAVVHEIYSTLSTLLPPPSNLQRQIQESLRNVMRLAVDLSIEMRTQRAEYIMLPPLQPEYDTNGDLVAKVTFNASLMNERSGETTSNDELESRGSIVKIVLFPLVVKKGDDFGEGEDEIVVCPAQVLIAKPSKKLVRVMSQAMSINRPDSRASRISRMTSIVPDGSVMDLSK
ncbi:hypothetical protein T440DRAFT_418119 [Plenodomus tracheiphilus IPT5]|uniref:Uncharacterized protein n=1 Tax=Plenodomus tracheiphilus IPT5 TaxID=1408161 RepID=A0A6A7BF98_9PLEO|nr:hypothetical protein T440DRAFT_418119 [Plenodomus tracheiphilus IPT5]